MKDRKIIHEFTLMDILMSIKEAGKVGSWDGDKIKNMNGKVDYYIGMLE